MTALQLVEESEGLKAMRALPGVLVLALLPAAGAAGPRIGFDSETHSWGTVYQGSRLQHVFQVRNDGDELLSIAGVRTSCGCTIAEGWPEKLMPGETGSLTATLDSARRQGETQTYVVVSSNDPERRGVNLKLHAVLEPAVDVAPGTTLSFGQVPVGEPAIARVEIWPRLEAGLALRKVEYPKDRFKIKTRGIARDDGRKGYEFAATLRAGLPAGTVHDPVDVQVEIDGIGVLGLGLTARGTIVGSYNASPTRFTLGLLEPGGRGEGEVVLRRNDDGVLKVRKVEADGKNATAEVIGPAEGQVVRVKLAVAAREGRPDRPHVAGKLRIYVDDPKEPVVEVPYMYALPYRGPAPSHGHPH